MMARDPLEKRTAALLLGGVTLGAGLWLVLRSKPAKAKSTSAPSGGGASTPPAGGSGAPWLGGDGGNVGGGAGAGGGGVGGDGGGAGAGSGGGGGGGGDGGAGAGSGGGGVGKLPLPSLDPIKDTVTINPQDCEPQGTLPSSYGPFIYQTYAPAGVNAKALRFVWLFGQPKQSDYEHARRLMEAAVKNEGSCIDTIPWFDRFEEQNRVSLPAISTGATFKDWWELYRSWNEDYEDEFKFFRENQPELASFYDATMFALAAGALNEMGMDPQEIASQDVNPPGGANSTVKAGAIILGDLGYQQTGSFQETVMEFQGDFNFVLDFMTNGQATVEGKVLDVDGIIGPQTFAALQFAIVRFENPWRWALARIQSMGA